MISRNLPPRARTLLLNFDNIATEYHLGPGTTYELKTLHGQLERSKHGQLVGAVVVIVVIKAHT